MRPRLTEVDREIFRLAVPALGALLAYPLFLLADSAIVGRLGTPELAALGLAGTLLATAVSLTVFLAYQTTGTVARYLGAGNVPGALRHGLDGCWLAFLLGIALAIAGWPLSGPAVEWFGATDEVAGHALTYLRVSLAGIPAMLVVFAGSGVLRGLQDTMTPLRIAVAGFAANAVLNVVLVFGVGPWSGLGIAGSALGTVLAQCGMAAAYVALVIRGARAHGVAVGLRWSGVRRAIGLGIPLLIRTATLRVTFLTSTVVAAHLGTVELAAHQIALTTYFLLSYSQDAIAIAAQALVGRRLGAGAVPEARALIRRMVAWGVAFGTVSGAALLLARPVYASLFTHDRDVKAELVAVLLVVAVIQPMTAWVFVLDGVLIGAGDGPYLAVAGLLTLVPYVPVVIAVDMADAGLPALWWAMALWIAARWVLLILRERSDDWVRTGELAR